MDVKKEDEIEEINKEHEQFLASQGPEAQTTGEIAGENSQIPSLLEDQAEKEELARKEEKLRLLIQQEVDNSNKLLMSQMPQVVVEVINQMRAQQTDQQNQNIPDQSQLTQAGNNTPQAGLPMDPNALTGIAQIIQAFRGGGGEAAAPDPFSQYFKQLSLDLLQMGMDGLRQQIYPAYQAVPKQATQAPQVAQNPKFTGFS
jgi:hypothetical protein